MPTSARTMYVIRYDVGIVPYMRFFFLFASYSRGGSLRPPVNRGSLYPPVNRGSLYPPVNRGSLYPPVNRGPLYPPVNRGSLYPPVNRGSLRPPVNRGSLCPPINRVEESHLLVLHKIDCNIFVNLILTIEKHCYIISIIVK